MLGNREKEDEEREREREIGRKSGEGVRITSKATSSETEVR